MENIHLFKNIQNFSKILQIKIAPYKIYCTLNASPNKTKQKSQSTTRWEFVFMPELLALALLCTSFMRPLLLLLRTWRTTMAPSTPCIIISARCTHPRRRLLSTKQNKKKVHCFARPSIQAHLLEWQDLPRENCSDLLWSFSSWRRVLWICWLLGGREKLRILKKSFEFFSEIFDEPWKNNETIAGKDWLWFFLPSLLLLQWLRNDTRSAQLKLS